MQISQQQHTANTDTITLLGEYRHWFFWLLGTFSLEAIIFCVLFYSQNVEYIGKPVQQEWLKSYGSQTLEEFVWRRYLIFEMLRRLPWAVYGIGIVWVTQRLPILQTQRGSGVYWRNVWYQLLIAITIACLHGLVIQNTLTILFRMETFPYYVYLRNFNGIFLSFVHYFVILLSDSMVNYYRQFRQEELLSAHLKTTAAQLETDLAQAQLHALKMQLQPHFLFNALNSISALLYHNPRRADSMIARLGDFLRMTLDNPTTQFITLRQELDLLKCYVDIEMMRFPSRLQVGISVEESLQEAQVPNLLLQPLVENSVKHGILQSTDGGRIDITVRSSPASPEILEITVRDNGPGLKPSEISSNDASTTKTGFNEGTEAAFTGKLHKKSSIGLQNTRERLQKLYGANFRFDTYNALEGGFVVYCEIPLRRRSTPNPEETLLQTQSTND
jgi:sensor histidine kinase YesM